MVYMYHSFLVHSSAEGHQVASWVSLFTLVKIRGERWSTMVKTWALEPNCLSHVLPLISCGTLGRFCNFWVPQFLYLYNEGRGDVSLVK